MIENLRHDYPVVQLCRILELPRSSYYYADHAVDEGAVLAAMEAVLMRWPFYGYRRLVVQLRRSGFRVGERVVRRLLQQLQRSRSVGRWRVITTDSRHGHLRHPNLVRNLSITQVDAVWFADITYIRLGIRFIYLAVILDGYTRAVRGWALGRQVDQALTLTALRQALKERKPHFFHSDQGAQYAATAHTQLLEQRGVHISMSAPGQPTQNALVERFMRTLKEEHVDYADYADLDEARRQLQHWLEVEYMTERIHSALGYLTPSEFQALAVLQGITPLPTA